MAFTAQTLAADAGTDGRVRQVTNQKIIAGINKWERTGTAATMPYPHFESSTQANSMVVPNKLRGLGDNKFNVAGWYNTNGTDGTEVTSSTNIVNGSYVYMDFIMVKSGTGGTLGYANVPGWISNLNVTVDVNNQVQSFTCTLDVDGPLPAVGVVT